MSEDYAKGFKDGFAAGLEEGKKLVPRDTVFQSGILGLPNTCQVCGRLQDMTTGYNCYSPKCPCRPAAYSIGPTGSLHSSEYPTGSNGPAGVNGSSDYWGKTSF